ncbi:hypothetical protein NC661_17170 [Aquibacillus koreensis]|uniref:Uncharacterized protein n=2 Tax=Aquibacillus koreensis TaxID=279446 RepID=A0A9X4AL53_9BACI|nr:hypothetical protein [Aquibacillus koreensis]MCT2536168.1 hypothetical protein [Aquibacillus koreensis]MDC3422093.1 hypothetical protein [Aquibacillus koreensis]
MDFELSLKNKRVRIWLWMMIPALSIATALFLFIPKEHNYIGILPIIIGYFIYIGWVIAEKKKQR